MFVVFVFAAVSLAAQEQATASPSAAPAIASSTVAVSSGVAAEPVATSGDARRSEGKLATTPEKATEPRAEGRADSENKPVREGDPNASQNLIEYGGP